MHGCMNFCCGRSYYKIFYIILDNGFSSTIVNVKIKKQLTYKPTSPKKWSTQARNFTTKAKAKVDLCLPEFSLTKIVMWKYHVDSTEGQYDMIV